LRLYDVQWLDDPSLAQARLGEEHLIKKHGGLTEDALAQWILKHAEVENVQARTPLKPDILRALRKRVPGREAR
jgi:hypothetical protein